MPIAPKIQLFLLLLLLFSKSVYSQTFGNGFYRLTTQWQGEGKSLDVINDGSNDKLQLAATNNASGQFWKITSLGDGYFRLTTQWLGENKSLDVINDGVNDRVHLTETANVSGQFWKITSVGNGYYRLTTKWLGEGKSLDIVNDGTNNKLKLTDSGNFSGQYWRIINLSSVSATPVTPDSAISSVKNFKQMSLSGFKIMINPDLADSDETKEAVNILSKKLSELETIIKPVHLKNLKKVPIWIQYKLVANKAMWYHPNKNWLINNGYPAEMTKSVEINNVRNFIDWQGDQPYMVLHELAHAHDDLDLAGMQDKIVQAYKNAVAGGKYNSVPYVRGGKQKAYALTDKTEYFAELTEAYFGKNDFYPFNREDLKEFDPEGYELMQEAWK